MSNQHRETNFWSKIDYRIVLFFAAFLLIALAILLYRMWTQVDCENVKLEAQSKNFLENENVQFSTNIQDAKEYLWDFGDGSPLSKTANPIHNYILPGKYFVRLTINGNCYAEKEILIKDIDDIVLHETVPEIIAPDVVRVGDPIPFDYYFADETKDVFSWEWSFGESGEMDKIEKNPTYVFQTPGQKRISLIINGDVRYISSKSIFVKPRKPIVNNFQYRQRIRQSVELDPGPAQIDPLDEYVMNLPVAPTPIPFVEPPVIEKKMAPDISSEQFEILLLKVAEQSKTKEDFSEYICNQYEIPVIKNDDELLTFADFCLKIKGEKIKVETLLLNRDKENNCIVSINIQYKVKKNLIWMKD